MANICFILLYQNINKTLIEGRCHKNSSHRFQKVNI
jgi:hypothetical protein